MYYAKKAAADIINASFSKNDPNSGAMYRYVLEKFIYWGSTLLIRKNNMPWFDEEGPTERILNYGKRLKSIEFYPIQMSQVEKLFYNFDPIPISFPMQSDFPLTSFIRYEKLLELRDDFSNLNLPNSCHEEFRAWLDETIEYKQDLLLYYY